MVPVVLKLAFVEEEAQDTKLSTVALDLDRKVGLEGPELWGKNEGMDSMGNIVVSTRRRNVYHNVTIHHVVVVLSKGGVPLVDECEHLLRHAVLQHTAFTVSGKTPHLFIY